MITYHEFLEQIREQVSELVEDEYTVRIMPVRRNNGVVLDSMMIAKPGDQVCPNIYLNQLYKWHQGGMSIPCIAERILMQYREAVPDESFDIGTLLSRESVCRNIVYRVVNSLRNKDLLEEVPHRDFLDLSLVYYILIRGTQIGDGAVLVRREHQKMWELDDEELDLAARENTEKLLPADILSISEMMEELSRQIGNSTYSELETEEVCRESPMYVLTNRDRQFGACYVANTGVLSELARREEDDLYILPSSVHECMIVPVRCGQDPEELGEMVREINRTQVDAEEFLSDSVYRFNREMNQVEIAA